MMKDCNSYLEEIRMKNIDSELVSSRFICQLQGGKVVQGRELKLGSGWSL